MNFLPITLAACLYASYGVFARLLNPYFGPFSQGIFRFVFMIPILFSLVIIGKKYKHIQAEDRKWFFFLALFSFGTGSLFYVSSIHLPLGVSLFLFYATSTIISYIVGKVFFKEIITWKKIQALLLSLLGLLLIFQVSLNNVKLVYLLIGLLAGTSFGLYTSTTKIISKRYSKEQIIFLEYVQIFILYILFSFLVKDKILLSISSILIATAFGLTELMTKFLTVLGFKVLEAQKAALILLLDPVLATAFGVILYHESLSINFVIGALLILIAMTLPEISEKWKISNIFNPA